MKTKIPKYPPISSAFPIARSTWTTSLSAPGGLVAKDHSCVAFHVRFKVDNDCDATTGREGGGEIGGGGGEPSGVAMGL